MSGFVTVSVLMSTAASEETLMAASVTTCEPMSMGACEVMLTAAFAITCERALTAAHGLT
jgi:hypothetical protein